MTADRGFADEANREYLQTEKIKGYISDNQFRSRDSKFDPIEKTCECPAGKPLSKESKVTDKGGSSKAFFKGKLSFCRGCELKTKCLRNPAAVDKINGHGRQVSFILEKTGTPYTDWMKIRVDSKKGKQIYSHRMSVVDR